MCVHGRSEGIVGYRLGLYDAADSHREVRHIGRLYRGTEADQLLIRETIAEFNELAANAPGYSLCLCAVAVPQESVAVLDQC
jgi:hypothetical protein